MLPLKTALAAAAAAAALALVDLAAPPVRADPTTASPSAMILSASPFQALGAVTIAAEEGTYTLLAQATLFAPAGSCALVAEGTPLVLTAPSPAGNAAARGFTLPGPAGGLEQLDATLAANGDASAKGGGATLPTAGASLAAFTAPAGGAAFALSESLAYSVPADAYAGGYTADVTLDLVCDPPPVAIASGAPPSQTGAPAASAGTTASAGGG